eukprot:12624107-Heterocapsa_arctica.AAC.1
MGRASWGLDLPAYLQHQSFFTRCDSKDFYRPNNRDFREIPGWRRTDVEARLLWSEQFSDNTM